MRESKRLLLFLFCLGWAMSASAQISAYADDPAPTTTDEAPLSVDVTPASDTAAATDTPTNTFEEPTVEDEIAPTSSPSTSESPSTETPATDTATESTKVPFESFSEHANEDASADSMDLVETAKKQNDVKAIPVIQVHPLLSLEVKDTLFDKYSEMEKNKMMMELQAEEKKAEIELARLKAEGLQVEFEISKLERKQKEEEEKAAKKAEEEAAAASSSDSSSSSSSYSSYSSSSDSYSSSSDDDDDDKEEVPDLSENYKLKSIMGVGDNLIGVVEDGENDKKIKVKVGTVLPNGYVVRMISPRDGIIFEKGEDRQTLKMDSSE